MNRLIIFVLLTSCSNNQFTGVDEHEEDRDATTGERQHGDDAGVPTKPDSASGMSDNHAGEDASTLWPDAAPGDANVPTRSDAGGIDVSKPDAGGEARGDGGATGPERPSCSLQCETSEGECKLDTTPDYQACGRPGEQCVACESQLCSNCSPVPMGESGGCWPGESTYLQSECVEGMCSESMRKLCCSGGSCRWVL